MIQEKLRRNALFLILPLLAALLSFFVLAGVASSSEFHKHSIAALEEKQTTVLELSAASAAASAAITLIPGDAATPIAEQLADLSSHFLVVLCAIYLEKYLLTITGFLAFKIPKILSQSPVKYRTHPVLFSALLSPDLKHPQLLLRLHLLQNHSVFQKPVRLQPETLSSRHP